MGPRFKIGKTLHSFNHNYQFQGLCLTKSCRELLQNRGKYFSKKSKLFRSRLKKFRNFSEIFKTIPINYYLYMLHSLLEKFFSFMTSQNFSEKSLNFKTIPPPKFWDFEKYLPLISYNKKGILSFNHVKSNNSRNQQSQA